MGRSDMLKIQIIEDYLSTYMYFIAKITIKMDIFNLIIDQSIINILYIKCS